VLSLVMNTSVSSKFVTLIFDLAQLIILVVCSLVTLSALDEIHPHAAWCSISTIIPQIRADVIVLNDV